MRNEQKPLTARDVYNDALDQEAGLNHDIVDASVPSEAEKSAEAEVENLLSEKKLKILARKQKSQLRQRTAAQLRDIMRRNALVFSFDPILSNQTPKLSSVNVVFKILRQEGGLIPAQHILAMAENSTVLIDIACWMVREICYLAKEFPPYISFAMPISIHQLQSQKFVSDVGVLVNLMKVNSGCLQFVLPLKIIEQHDEMLDHTIKSLAEIGVRFSINQFQDVDIDFAALRERGFSTVLLDRHLTASATQDKDKQKLLKRFVKEAHKHDVKLRAVGVDSTVLAKLCLRIGIDEVQGSVIAPETPVIHFGASSQLGTEGRQSKSVAYRLTRVPDTTSMALAAPASSHAVGILHGFPQRLLRE